MVCIESSSSKATADNFERGINNHNFQAVRPAKEAKMTKTRRYVEHDNSQQL
jgi:hypothetical protein